MKQRKKVPAAVLLLCLLISLVSAAGAANISPQVDPSKSGSITFTMKSGGKLVPGGSLKVYQVAVITKTDGKLVLKSTKAFADFTGNLNDMSSKTLPGKLLTYAEKNNVSGTKLTIGSDGKGTVGNLTPGLYLIAQDVPAKGYTDIIPFLIMIPTQEDGKLVYDVKAYPKVEPDKPDEPDNPDKPDEPDNPDKPDEPDHPDKPDEPDHPDKPDEPDNPDKPDEPDHPDKPDEPDNPDKPDEPDTPDNPDKPDEPDNPDKPDKPDNPDNPSKPDKPDDDGKLPQTGQLWWPVSVLAGAGLILLIYGWSRWTRTEEEED